ncbi:MAG: Hpt domain-containing protein [Pseudomonadota bacterium]
MNDDEAIKARIEVLAKVFTGRLHVRFEKLNETFALCARDHGDDANWAELHRQLHSLADAAASFGFDALGVQASRIALRVTALLAQSERHQHDVDQVGQALAALQQTDLHPTQ